MVNSDKGITNLQVPSDVIVDASMPAMIRTSGQMYDKDGKKRYQIALFQTDAYAGFILQQLISVKNTVLSIQNNGKCSKRWFDGSKSRRIWLSRQNFPNEWKRCCSKSR
jgi:hypothetical protein